MAYEVWFFEQPEESDAGPSRLVSIATCPPEYGYADADRWALQQRELYAQTDGPEVTTLVRVEGCY